MTPIDIILLPTRSKTKIPQSWSFPVGAENASKALETVPHYKNIGLRFLWLNPASRLASRDKTRLHILGVRYTNPRQTALHENWSVDISAVPSAMKAALREQILHQILPATQSWMTAERSPSWYESSKQLDVFFNLETEQFEYLESGEA